MPDAIQPRAFAPALVDTAETEAPAGAPPRPDLPATTTKDLVQLVKGAEAQREAGRYNRFAEAQRKAETEARPTAREVGMCKTLVSNPVKALAIVGVGALGAAVSPNKIAGGVGGAAVGAIAGGLAGDAAAALVCDPPGTK